MRIVSLLPSLTELVCALGHRAGLVGVTHECDWPPGVETLPHLTRSRIPRGSQSAEIDALVAEQGGSLYELDAAALQALKPALVLTQAQCDVCAVNEQTVRRVAESLPSRVSVESVNPTDLAGVFAVFQRVGDLLGARPQADALVARFEATAQQIASRRQGRPRPATVLLEWLDPPFTSGHWNPEILSLAGGREQLGRPGKPSRRSTWTEVAAAAPEVVIVSPCGFPLEQTLSEWPIVAARPEWRSFAAENRNHKAVVDGSAYFSRPGPRLEASLRIAAAVIDPERCGELAPEHGWQWLFE
jgi:iron complex transport system substrate-binding protein